ncbi:DUF5626 family protein [Amphibacillus jilinensis]|uniref:DUF5626 family protein n=1 Tax=Amphibacillus jilinensis TaxID=1216008 RepID=UPI0003162F0C|nr:DUF5626 family protein [Amphibacillus jilinensis]
MKKYLAVCFGALMSLLFLGNVAFASELNLEDESSEIPEEFEVEFDLDLESTEVQEQKFIGEDGEEWVMGLEPVILEEPEMTIQKSKIIPAGRSRTYRVYWNTAVASMEYHVTVKRSSENISAYGFTNVYGLKVNTVFSEKNRKFTWSKKLAEYTGSIDIMGTGTVGLRLTSRVSGIQLHISGKPFAIAKGIK